MKKGYLIHFFLYTLGLLSVMVCGIILASATVEKHIYNQFKLTGLSSYKVENYKIKKNALKISKIYLDDDQFSSISGISARFSVPDFTIDELTIKNMQLAGELTSSNTIIISGLDIENTLSLKSIPDDIKIETITLDLVTAEGGITVNGQAYISKTDKGYYNVISELYADQYQLKFNSVWNGKWIPGQNAIFRVEFSDAHVKFKDLFASRIAGKSILGFNKNKLIKSQGQITIGSLNHYNLPISSPIIQWKMNNKHSKVKFKGRTPGQSPVKINIDITDQMLNASVQTKNIESFLSFITATNETLRIDEYFNKKFKQSLLNVLGANKDLRTLQDYIKTHKNYDFLVLHVQGPMDDLSGKVLVKETSNNSSNQHVIRLDPLYN
jgi:hypothetical protein